MRQMWRLVHVLLSMTVSSVNSVPADTRASRQMEDHTSRVYHASVMDTQTHVILRLECAWNVNTTLQVGSRFEAYSSHVVFNLRFFVLW